MLRGEPIGTVQGILFDKDGTLSNSESHLFNLAQLRVREASRILKSQGATSKSIKKLEKFLSIAYGMTNDGIDPHGTIAIGSRENNKISTATIFCLLGEKWPKALELSNIVFEIVDNLDNSFNKQSEQRKLLPGVRQTLENLQSANITCALISNDSRAGIQSFLSKNNLRGFLSHYWSADDYPCKPDPAAVSELCKNLGLEPAECALIGDADSDLSMARESGIGITLGYTGGWSQKPDLTEHQHLIHNWNELTINQNTKLTFK